MPCNRCQQVFKVSNNLMDCYVSLPTNHHNQSFEKLCKQQQLIVKAIEDDYLVVQIDFKVFIKILTASLFSKWEQDHVKLLPLELGKPLNFSNLKNLKTLSQWQDWMDGEEIVEVINQKRIVTLFQPIIDVTNHTIYGYETLSRGVRPDGSMISAVELFSKAKKLDLLFQLDRLCRESSIIAAANANIQNKVFINFIPTTIYQPELCLKTTEAVLEKYKLKSNQIVFEVVETEEVDDFHHLNKILDYYKSKGFSTALDDLGSGFSDMNAFIKLNPTYLKVDRDLISNIDTNVVYQLKLKEYIDHARKISAIVLAEGVETKQEFEYLKQVGVDLVQGYYFGKPQAKPTLEILNR